jgi:dTDP-4-amino-4,6-dideoxygalactose transaminase
LARELRQLRIFGFADDYRTVSVGTNGKMSEIAAALGLTSIESMDRIVDANGANHRAYKAALSGVPGITLVPRDPAERHNYQYVVVLVDERGAGISRDTLLDVLAAENVFARKYFWPGCHRQPIYRARSGHVRLPVTEMLAERVLILPTGTAVTLADIRIIGEIIASAVAGAADLQRLAATSRP